MIVATRKQIARAQRLLEIEEARGNLGPIERAALGYSVLSSAMRLTKLELDGANLPRHAAILTRVPPKELTT